MWKESHSQLLLIFGGPRHPTSVPFTFFSISSSLFRRPAYECTICMQRCRSLGKAGIIVSGFSGTNGLVRFLGDCFAQFPEFSTTHGVGVRWAHVVNLTMSRDRYPLYTIPERAWSFPQHLVLSCWTSLGSSPAKHCQVRGRGFVLEIATYPSKMLPGQMPPRRALAPPLSRESPPGAPGSASSLRRIVGPGSPSRVVAKELSPPFPALKTDGRRDSGWGALHPTRLPPVQPYGKVRPRILT
ncbi:hypothetical protein VUR80DRAFT_5310 [Thermomyces stellatus]